VIRVASRDVSLGVMNIRRFECLVLAIALVVLSPRRLAGAGRALGSGVRDFKDSIDGRLEGLE
jgi:hypothetical protein